VHVGFPVVGYQHAWFAEGLATYVEPVARARAGVVSREKFWGDLVEGLPQGLPGASNTGLDGTEEWGRVYWGGALYFLLADLTIRERTAGARSLDDAVRAVASTGANVETHWPLERVMDAGDRATGTTVLQELYAQYGVSPGKIELAALWAKLGIRQGKRSEPLAFENGAPWAGYRDAITARRSERISRPPRD
jgi:predicted metalloprotease with PDZ domain